MIWIADVGCQMSDVRSLMSDVGYIRGDSVLLKKSSVQLCALLCVTLWFYNLDFFNTELQGGIKTDVGYVG